MTRTIVIAIVFFSLGLPLVFVLINQFWNYPTDSRKKAISAEYRILIETVERDPRDKTSVNKLTASYRSHIKDEWARLTFFSQISTLGPVYRSDSKSTVVFNDSLLPLLREGVKDNDEVVRFQAVSAAGRFGFLSAPLVDDLIIVMLNHPNDGYGILAIRVFGEIGPSASNAIDPLKNLGPTNPDAIKSLEIIQRK